MIMNNKNLMQVALKVLNKLQNLQHDSTISSQYRIPRYVPHLTSAMYWSIGSTSEGNIEGIQNAPFTDLWQSSSRLTSPWNTALIAGFFNFRLSYNRRPDMDTASYIGRETQRPLDPPPPTRVIPALPVMMTGIRPPAQTSPVFIRPNPIIGSDASSTVSRLFSGPWMSPSRRNDAGSSLNQIVIADSPCSPDPQPTISPRRSPTRIPDSTASSHPVLPASNRPAPFAPIPVLPAPNRPAPASYIKQKCICFLRTFTSTLL